MNNKTPFRVYSSLSFQLKKTTGKNWIAVGDAAIYFDPRTSQGVHKPLLTGIAAAKSIIDTFKGLSDLPFLYAEQRNKYFNAYLTTRQFFYKQEKR
ncbi:NAD(P)/FAD-dependent oxidoreductase [Colwellia psychrerythraea]|uniref:Uncharacterized protein n=1 Tax=Colwellia psychrerythraea TaxID=28229 RepID=A0A099KVY4_COLPS|nr:hypothetical protein [Colwellia psychrerythraea]KGJ94904.1 hypothetical protein GAB14E_2138 [Colwellia psychrerythraea]